MAGMGADADLAPMLGIEDEALDAHLEGLCDDGLIKSADPPYDLTPQAQFVINERFEDINF
jgi:predicted transcriptional regulator